jgi:threonine dehydrogenase-like Zn-dependent dehydrogenase
VKALAWHGKHDIRCESVPDPRIEHPRDAIIKVTACAICGSDLHIYNGIIPRMKSGDVLGHENMGEVVEVGADNKKLKVGDRVVVPFTIACGECFFCKNGFFSGCERSNPDHEAASKLWGNAPAGLFGYSHLCGGYAGGQPQYLRVPYADVGPIKVPDGMPDEQVLFLSDIFPTGYMAADFCDIKGAETIAVWGCGPVGQFAIRSAILLGAGRVIAIDTVPERLALARDGGAETLDFMVEDIYDRIMELTKGRGADACIDAVGTKLTRARALIPGGIESKWQPSWAPIAPMCCARQFTAAVTSERYPLWVSMAAFWTRFQWAPRSIAGSHSGWRRPQFSVTCRSCSNSSSSKR